MTAQLLIAIASLCHYSIAPASSGYGNAYANNEGQLGCQKFLIKCVREDKSTKKTQATKLADCIENMEWK